MGHSYENAGFGSHGYCALGSNRGPFDPFEKPTIDSGNESIVATHAIFIRRGAIEKLMGHFHEIPPWQRGSVAKAAGGLSLSRENQSDRNRDIP